MSNQQTRGRRALERIAAFAAAARPVQLEPARIQAPVTQAPIVRVELRPAPELTARYPSVLGARITVRTRDGQNLVVEQFGYEDGLARPLS
jgi:2-methylcitrate dehydratase